MSDEIVPPMKDEDVVVLVSEAIDTARNERRRSGADGDNATPDVQQQPGITIDLGHRNIQHLPEEVIDIIKDEIERLALPHNSISFFPSRLAECTRLRYLNVRYNALKEFPQPVLQLSSLEILDISKNKLRALPDEVSSLASLKVLAISKNRIERLPLCLGDMGSLRVLKVDGNPLIFPPSDVYSIKSDTPAPANENEKEAVITAQVKKYLRQISTHNSNRQRLQVESEGETSEANVETTPRPPRRAIIGRFPVKPSVSGLEFLSDSRATSPGLPPPIPNRSHFRNQSQQNSISHRTGLAPPFLSDRNRSHSESVGSTSLRAKRMGFSTRKAPDLRRPDDHRPEGTNHYRVSSYGSTMSESQVRSAINYTSGTATPGEGGELASLRNVSTQRLSDLLEHKRRSRAPDAVVEAAKGIRYSISQLLDPLSSLLNEPKKAGSFRRHDLRTRVSIASAQVRVLEKQLQEFDTLAEEDEDEAGKLSVSIRQTCALSIKLAESVGTALYDNVREVVQDGDARAIRTLMHQLYAGSTEIRIACSALGTQFTSSPKTSYRINDYGRSITPTQGRPLPGHRLRESTASTKSISRSLAQNGAMSPSSFLGSNLSSRTNTLTSQTAATPRSGESFTTFSTATSRSNTMRSIEDTDEERLFETIYVKLKQACDLTLELLPMCHQNFSRARDIALRDMTHDSLMYHNWAALMERCELVLNNARVLLQRLGMVKLRDPIIRNQHDFWVLCRAYSESWTELAGAVKSTSQLGLLLEDVKLYMKPIHKAVKEVSRIIDQSPWSHLTVRGAAPPPLPALSTSASSSFSSVTAASANLPVPAQTATPLSAPPIPLPALPTNPLHASLPHQHPLPSSITTSVSPSYATSAASTPGYVTPVPATPLSAALGPAAQATVPTTPSQGVPVGPGVFERGVVERLIREQQVQQGTMQRRV